MYAFLSRVKFVIQRCCIAPKPEQGQVVSGTAPFPRTGLRSPTTALKSAPLFILGRTTALPKSILERVFVPEYVLYCLSRSRGVWDD